MVAFVHNQPRFRPLKRVSLKTHTPDRHLHISGRRYYNPQLGRWINRDPIGEHSVFLSIVHDIKREEDFLRLLQESRRPQYLFADNAPSINVDLLGLATVDTGLQRCTVRTLWIVPVHQYLKWDNGTANGGTAGFGHGNQVPFAFPGTYFGIVSSPDAYRGQGTCTPVKVDPCRCDPALVKQCVIEATRRHRDGEWGVPHYHLLYFNCINYASWVIEGCCKMVQEGNYPIQERIIAY